MFLSIIIPVFNAEKYIDECLQSCLCQDIDKQDYQIICVNDGSKDKSLDIINRYASKYPNIIVFNQKNAGVSIARNTGLKLATGDYIWFVDSDDIIRQNCLGELKSLSESGYDIINFGGYSFNFELSEDDKKILCKSKPKPNKIYWGYAMFKIYKSSIIVDNNIYFNPKIKYGEDEVFNNDVFAHAKNSTTLDHSNYFYRKSPNSAMATMLIPENQIKRLESVIISMLILKEGIENGIYTNDFSKKFLKDRYELVQYCLKRLDTKLAFKYIKDMKNKGLFSFEVPEIKELNLPCKLKIQFVYLKQHFQIWSKAFYKKSRTKIKKILPKSIVKIIKKIFKMPD